MLGTALARAAEAPGSGWHWGQEAHHASLPRGERVRVETAGNVVAHDAHDDRNIPASGDEVSAKIMDKFSQNRSAILLLEAERNKEKE